MAILWGDCLYRLQEIASETVDMVYLDPPFFSQRTHTLTNKKTGEVYRLEDKWESRKHYVEYLRCRLVECHRVLKPTGSLFLHCDKTSSHNLRVLLDEIFGREQFQNEIIWYYKRWSKHKKGLQNNHQTIYFYSKTKQFKFYEQYQAYSNTTNVEQLLQKRDRYEGGRVDYKRNEIGEILVGKPKQGVPLGDVWEIPFLNPKALERVGYPTQKPVLLLERLIEMVTDKGDVVLDPFLGSGTTAVAAKRLQRRFIGIDQSEAAIRISLNRLQSLVKTESKMLQGKTYGYKVQEQEILNYLKALDAVPVHRSCGIDGFLKYHMKDRPVAIRIQRQDETLEEAKTKLINAAQSKLCSVLIVLHTHQDRDSTQKDMKDKLYSLPQIIVIESYQILLKQLVIEEEKQ